MPWHLPAELQYFKKITLGKPVIMGRKTFESIGKPLPGRKNIVITRQTSYQHPGIEIVHSLETALQAVQDTPEVMIIGGATLYEKAIAYADRLYITKIDLNCEGDTFFPQWDEKQWRLIEKKQYSKDEKNSYDFTTFILERS